MDALSHNPANKLPHGLLSAEPPPAQLDGSLPAQLTPLEKEFEKLLSPDLLSGTIVFKDVTEKIFELCGRDKDAFIDAIRDCAQRVSEKITDKNQALYCTLSDLVWVLGKNSSLAYFVENVLSNPSYPVLQAAALSHITPHAFIEPPVESSVIKSLRSENQILRTASLDYLFSVGTGGSIMALKEHFKGFPEHFSDPIQRTLRISGDLYLEALAILQNKTEASGKTFEQTERGRLVALKVLGDSGRVMLAFNFLSAEKESQGFYSEIRNLYEKNKRTFNLTEKELLADSCNTVLASYLKNKLHPDTRQTQLRTVFHIISQSNPRTETRILLNAILRHDSREFRLESLLVLSKYDRRFDKALLNEMLKDVEKTGSLLSDYARTQSPGKQSGYNIGEALVLALENLKFAKTNHLLRKIVSQHHPDGYVFDVIGDIVATRYIKKSAPGALEGILAFIDKPPVDFTYVSTGFSLRERFLRLVNKFGNNSKKHDEYLAKKGELIVERIGFRAVSHLEPEAISRADKDKVLASLAKFRDMGVYQLKKDSGKLFDDLSG